MLIKGSFFNIFSILHKNADSPEQLFAGFTLLTDRHPHSRKDFLKLVDDMHQFSIEHIKRNYTFLEAYLKRIKIWESTEDQNDRERYTQFLKDHTGKCLRREFFEGLTFEQHVELIPEGISLIEYLKCIPQGYQHMILIKYWKEISREELSACLSELPDDDRIFLSTITGQVTTYAQLVALKKRFTKLPEALYVQFATQYLQSVPIHALESVLKKLPQYDKKLLADIEKQTLQASARLKLIQHYPLASGDDAIAFIVRHLDCVIDPDCAYQVFSAFQAQSKKITSQRVIASRMEHQDILGAFAVLACHMPAA